MSQSKPETADAFVRIHESPYGGPMNYHLKKRGATLQLDITYPPRTDAEENPSNKVRFVEINQESVRASDGIRVHYDYDRDGFAVEQPRDTIKIIKRDGERVLETASIEEWIEVGFFRSHAFQPDQIEDFDRAQAEWAAAEQGKSR